MEVGRDLDRLVRGTGVQRPGVVRRDDRDSLDPELAARPEHAEGDLAPIRHE
jgi:hypothetical protein